MANENQIKITKENNGGKLIYLFDLNLHAFGYDSIFFFFLGGWGWGEISKVNQRKSKIFTKCPLINFGLGNERNCLLVLRNKTI